MKYLIIIPLLIINLTFASEESKDDSNSSGFKQTYITAKAVDDNIIPDLQYIVNQHLIGDSLETSEEFINALTLNLNYSHIHSVTRESKFLIITTDDNDAHIFSLDDGKKIGKVEKIRSGASIYVSNYDRFLVMYSNEDYDKIIYKIFDTQTKEIKIFDTNIYWGRPSFENLKYFTVKLSDYLLKYDLISGEIIKQDIINDSCYMVNSCITYNKKYHIFKNGDFLKFYNIDNEFEFEILAFKENIELKPCFVRNQKYLILINEKLVKIIDLENKQIINEFEGSEIKLIFDENNNAIVFQDGKNYFIFDFELKKIINLPSGIINILPIYDTTYLCKTMLIQISNSFILYDFETHKTQYLNLPFDTTKTIIYCYINDSRTHLHIRFRLTDEDNDIHYLHQIFNINSQEEEFKNVMQPRINNDYLIYILSDDFKIYDLNTNKIVYSLQLNGHPLDNFHTSISDNYIFIDKISKNCQKQDLIIFDLNLNKPILELKDIPSFSYKQKINYVAFKLEGDLISIFDLKKQKFINHNFDLSKKDNYYSGRYPEINYSGDNESILMHNTGIVIYNKFNKSILHKLKPMQIALIICLYHKNKQLTDSQDQDKVIYLNAKFTKLFKTLPIYVQRCLRSNYNLVFDGIENFNLIEENLENSSQLL